MTEASPIKPRYRYYYSTEGPSPHGTSSEPTKAEAQEFVNASLGLLTGGCELCLHNDRMFCQKRKRLVEFGDTRCEYFTRRTAAKGLDSIGI